MTELAIITIKYFFLYFMPISSNIMYVSMYEERKVVQINK